MRYLFQRVVHNDAGWTAPTPGRQQFTGDGEYLEETGFGHEDWNLSADVCANGYVHGYMYYRPKNTEGPFNILFATYDKGEGWALSGYYEKATFIEEGATFPRGVLRRRAQDLKALDEVGSLGGEYRAKSADRIVTLLTKEARHYRWQVRPDDVHTLQQQIRAPKSFTSRFGAYFTRPTELDKSEWSRLIKLAGRFTDKARMDDYIDGGDTEFPEGKNTRFYTRRANAIGSWSLRLRLSSRRRMVDCSVRLAILILRTGTGTPVTTSSKCITRYL